MNWHKDYHLYEHQLKTLEDRIKENIDLLNNCRKVRDTTRDPMDRAKYDHDIEKIKNTLNEYNNEYSELKKSLDSLRGNSGQLPLGKEKEAKLLLSQLDLKVIDLGKMLGKASISALPPEPKPAATIETTVKGNYTRLRQYLEQQLWREADQETMITILKVANRESEKWLAIEHINIFSCPDIRVIDNLWFKLSEEKFGLRVQQNIWQNMGGHQGIFDESTFRKFGQQVGWYSCRNWLDYENFDFSANAFKGCFPSWRLASDNYGNWSRNFRGFLIRASVCLEQTLLNKLT
jgi:hypothetical protein